MNNTGLTYDIYTHDTLAVHGDKKMYHKLIKSIGGRWSSRLKIGGPGWIVPRDKQHELDEIIMSYKFSSMEKNAKSRQEQHKYHRSVSCGKHTDNDIPTTTAQENTTPVQDKPYEEEKTLEEMYQKHDMDSKVLNHYKKYSNSPSPVKTHKKKKHYISSSSENDSSSSESDFPSYELQSKKKKAKKELKKVTEKMEYLKRKKHKLERKLY